MNFKIPSIPNSVSTKGNNGTPPTTNIQNVQNNEQPVNNLTQQQVNNEEPTVAQVTFEIPIHMLQAFQMVVQKADYLEGQENLALLQAIDLWLQATSHHLDGNHTVFLTKDGLTSHMNLNPKIDPAIFEKDIIAFHELRKQNLEKLQNQE